MKRIRFSLAEPDHIRQHATDGIYSNGKLSETALLCSHEWKSLPWHIGNMLDKNDNFALKKG
jgi:hypothetical protein